MSKQTVGFVDLYEWGRWVRQDSDRLGYQSPWLLLMRNNVQISRAPAPAISDDEAMTIDAAVAKLARHSLVLHRVLCYHYICGWSLRRIARAYLTPLEYGADSNKRVSVYAAQALLARAEGFVHGTIENG